MSIHRLRRAGALAIAVVTSGCAESPADYLPFAEGRQWHYRVTRNEQLRPIQEELSIRVDGIISLGGQSVAVFAQPPYSKNYYTADQDGIRRVATARGMDGAVIPDSADHYVLRYPGGSAGTWILPSTLALIEERISEGVAIRDQKIPLAMTYKVAGSDAEVSVPAGSYRGCLRIDGTGAALVPVHKGETTVRVDVASSDWYAPGVGLVKSVRTETSPSDFLVPGTYTQELAEVR